MKNQKVVMYRGNKFIASFENSAEASRIMNLDKQSIEQACAGEMKKAGEYRWGYERRAAKRKNHGYV